MAENKENKKDNLTSLPSAEGKHKNDPEFQRLLDILTVSTDYHRIQLFRNENRTGKNQLAGGQDQNAGKRKR